MSEPKFDKPIGEWIDEPVDVATIEPVFSKSGEFVSLKRGKKTVNQRTMYSQMSDPQSIDCGNKNHFWHLPDKHNHVSHCKKCPKRVLIRAVFEKVIDGKIVHRDTGVHLQ